ncbi:MAG: site-2 protease family protein, partial [Candidatus Margulisiibacteriota bacterium]
AVALPLAGLAGPLGIAQFSGQAASQGFPSLLFFIGLISINLGVFNLLPLPALDGGRLVFILIEAVRGKPIPIERENKIHQWGLIALLLLAAVVSVNDLFRILKR